MTADNILKAKLAAAGIDGLGNTAMGVLTAAGMSIKDTARFLGIGRSLVYEEIRAGRLIARKAGRRTIITRDDALTYLRSLSAVSTAA